MILLYYLLNELIEKKLKRMNEQYSSFCKNKGITKNIIYDFYIEKKINHCQMALNY